MFHRQPSSILLAAGDALLDEIHPFHSIMHIGVDGVEAFHLSAFRRIDHRVKSCGIDVRESFEEGLRMSGRQAAGGSARSIHVRGIGIAGVQAMGLSIRSDHHDVGFFLTPGQSPSGTIDFDP
jgi:hypothetical protein